MRRIKMQNWTSIATHCGCWFLVDCVVLCSYTPNIHFLSSFAINISFPLSYFLSFFLNNKIFLITFFEPPPLPSWQPPSPLPPPPQKIVYRRHRCWVPCSSCVFVSSWNRAIFGCRCWWRWWWWWWWLAGTGLIWFGYLDFFLLFYYGLFYWYIHMEMYGYIYIWLHNTGSHLIFPTKKKKTKLNSNITHH